LIGSLTQPILFLLAFGFGFGKLYSQAGEGSYIQFLAPGIIAMGVLFTSIHTGIEIIWDKQFGFLKETLVAPVSRFEIMLGRTLGGATVGLIQGLIVLLLTLVVGFRPTNIFLVPLGFLFIFLVGVLFTSVGTAIASKLEDMQGFQLIMNLLIMPTFFLSGALFPLDGLPKAMEIITKINPLTYGVDGLRGALIGVSSFGLSFDFIVLTIVALVLLSIGSYLFSKIQV